MTMQKHDYCNAYFEDFTYEQRSIFCPTCLVLKVECFGGSHPRAVILAPAPPLPGNKAILF